MRCARCLRPIREAYFVQAGKSYGPTCGKKLGLAVGLRDSPITRRKAAHPRVAVVQDGQAELFDEIIERAV